jgi:hypothetical protein
MCARFTVLSDTPIATAIAGCVIPLSRNSTIWMRWRCMTGIFHRSAVFSRCTSALLHLTFCCPESDGASESHLGEENSRDYLSKISIQAVMEVVYKAHFPADPAYSVASRVETPRMPNSALLPAALAALEHEFRTTD